MPSRRKIAWVILLLFLFLFFGLLLWYFGPALFATPSLDEEGNPTRDVNLFPFGGGGGGFDYDIFDDEDEDLREEVVVDEAPRVRQPQLRQLAEGPVIGATMFPSEGHSGVRGRVTATTTDDSIANTFRYIELGTGHVFQGATNNGEITRISNTTIPKISQALFVNPDRLLIRYPDDSERIKTFSGELVTNFAPGASTEKRLQGVFLQDNILEVAPSRAGKLLFLAREGDVYRIYTSDSLGDNQTQVYEFPVGEWRLSWNDNEEEALLHSTPSYETYGVAYTLDTTNGSLRPYTNARKALSLVTTPSRSQAILSVRGGEGETSLFSWQQETNQYINLGLAGFAEKCLWAEERARFYCALPRGEVAEAEPDLWYQGVTQYSDEVWEIDPATGRSEILFSPARFAQDFDILDLTLSPDEQFLYFRDKVSRSLWSYQIDYEETLFTAPNSRRTRERLEFFDQDSEGQGLELPSEFGPDAVLDVPTSQTPEEDQ